jgi:hypothetical protein
MLTRTVAPSNNPQTSKSPSVAADWARLMNLAITSGINSQVAIASAELIIVITTVRRRSQAHCHIRDARYAIGFFSINRRIFISPPSINKRHYLRVLEKFASGNSGLTSGPL